MQYKTSRQQVTGLVVNTKVNVTREYRKLVRAYVFSLVNHGRYTIKTVVKDDKGRFVEETEEGRRSQLHGMLGFIHSVDNVYQSDVRDHPYNYPGQQRSNKNPTGNLAIYRKFLLYTLFYDNKMPLIVCEGKTDGVYISNAVHQSKAIFPQLLTKNDDGKDVLSFQLFKYTRQHKKKKNVYMPNFSTASILGASSGGGGNLGNLIRAYHKELNSFKAPIGDHPVIFIVDNDDGGRTVYKIIKETLKIAMSGHESFVRLFANLYIVPVPFNGNAQRSIEDLFTETDISKGLNGKRFDFSNNANSSASVGKAEFAYEFVAKQAETLDWTGFHSLLNNICAVLVDYETSA